MLANEEVIDGKSERGGYPVVRMPLTQWMLRITAYAERLIEDLDDVDWPRPIKDMQRNWVGRSEGAEVDFPIRASERQPRRIRVYTTRPDTLVRRDLHGPGARASAGRPDHDAGRSRPSVDDYRQQAASKSDLDRTDLAKTKTGVFTGGLRDEPGQRPVDPVWIADYVLMGYGTGAIMAVPGHDERDFEFAQAFNLPIVRVVASEHGPGGCAADQAEPEPGIVGQFAEQRDHARRPAHRRGEGRDHRLARKARARQEDHQLQAARLAVLAPALLGRAVSGRARRATTAPMRLPKSELPVRLPELEDFKPTGKPEPPLSKAKDWVRYSDKYRRETNTMPQWAGSCWYYLRYIDPHNDKPPWDPEKERTGCRWTSTSAAPSTPCFTCSTAGSGTRCSSTAGWSARPSRSRSWSTRG